METNVPSVFFSLFFYDVPGVAEVCFLYGYMFRHFAIERIR